MTGPDTAPEGTLASVFANHREQPWIFVRPGGNWGDHLIYAGAEALARRCGIAPVTHDSASFADAPTSAEHCIYLHGGGGYNTWGTGRPFHNLAHAVSRNVRLVVQGPQTLESAGEAVAGRFVAALNAMHSQQTVFFARERQSFAALQALALPSVEIGLDHDTAFHLQTADILKLAALDRVPSGRYDLTAYREDDEQPASAGGTRARGIILDPAYVAESFEHWLRIHLFARTLLTNRLHSGIVCALIGKPVTIAFGSYHKNRSIWEYSLAQRSVDWTEGIRVGRRFWASLPDRLRESYKLCKLRLMLQRVPLR